MVVKTQGGVGDKPLCQIIYPGQSAVRALPQNRKLPVEPPGKVLLYLPDAAFQDVLVVQNPFHHRGCSLAQSRRTGQLGAYRANPSAGGLQSIKKGGSPPGTVGHCPGFRQMTGPFMLLYRCKG